MTAAEKYGLYLRPKLLSAYFDTLVDMFFKILPMWEEGSETLPDYLDRFLRELIGFRALASTLHDDARIVSIMAIIQYLIENPECRIGTVKRMVFHAISICDNLRMQYAGVRR